MIDLVFASWFQVVGYANCVAVFSIIIILELFYTVIIEPLDVF
jgi:hypothetical protein